MTNILEKDYKDLKFEDEVKLETAKQLKRIADALEWIEKEMEVK